MSADVISKNFFDLLGDDESGETPVVKPVAAAKKDQKAAPAKKEAPKKVADRAPRNEYPRRGGARGGAVEGAAPRAPRAPRETGDFEHPREVRADDGERRERVGFRGGRGGRGGARGGRGREFDRHSGSGRVDGVKKEVAGKGSWGDPLTAEQEAKTELVDAEGNAEKAEVAAEVEGANTPEVAAEPKEQDPEDSFKSLDQYLAEKARPAKEANVRKPNEGADDGQWKNAKVLAKEEDEELFADLLKTKKSKAAAAKKDAKTFVSIDLRYNEEGRSSFTERGERGGRGGARGGRGRGGSDRGAPRGGARGGARAGSSVSIEDQTAFPSLGGK